ARRRVRGARLDSEPDTARQRQLVDAFLAASREGDFDRLVELLDSEVVFRADVGATTMRMPTLITGAHDVARHMANQGRRFAPRCRPALVNGSPGILVARPHGQAISAVIGFGVRDGRISTIDFIADPEKLPHDRA
ncbi:MAG: RNA polymerase subunit sigma-70, partial [Mycobacterium sp.]|nr:RNA polymerase subunit sigma-70 [Mycobacterium sp.]